MAFVRKFGQIITELVLQPGQPVPAYLSTYKAEQVSGGTLYTPSGGGQSILIKSETQTHLPPPVISVAPGGIETMQPSPPPPVIEITPGGIETKTFFDEQPQKEMPQEVLQQEVPSVTETKEDKFPSWIWIAIAGLTLMMFGEKKNKR